MSGWLDEREAAAWRSLRSLMQPLETALNRQLARDSGLSTADYGVLVQLSEADHHRLRIRDLVAATGWEKSRVSHQIRRMESRGLVVKQECPTDLRGAFIRLTAQGLVTIQQAAPGHVAEVRRLVVDVLTSEQLDQLTAIGAQVAGALQDSGSGCAAAESDCGGAAADDEDSFATLES